MNKKILLLLAVCVISITASAQTAFYKSYCNHKNFETVYISKTMLDLGISSAGDMDLSKLAGKLNSIEIVSTDSGLGMQMLRNYFIQKLSEMKEAELLMSATDKNDKVTIYMIKKGDLKEYYMLVEKPDEAIAIVFTGTMSPSDILKVRK